MSQSGREFWCFCFCRSQLLLILGWKTDGPDKQLIKLDIADDLLTAGLRHVQNPIEASLHGYAYLPSRHSFPSCWHKPISRPHFKASGNRFLILFRRPGWESSLQTREVQLTANNFYSAVYSSLDANSPTQCSNIAPNRNYCNCQSSKPVFSARIFHYRRFFFVSARKWPDEISENPLGP